MSNNGTYEDHPIATTFPEMSESDFKALTEDIKKNGQLGLITLHEGKILDGRHRYRACKLLGITPEHRVFDGDDPIAFAISVNDCRRHSTASQRAATAALLANMKRGDNQHTPNGRTSEPVISQAKAAKRMKVGVRSVSRATNVLKHSPALLKEVKDGKKPLQDAVKEVEKAKEKVAPKELLDATGHPVPANLIEDWERAKTTGNELRRKISDVKCALETGLKNEDVIYREMNNTDISPLTSSHFALSQILPYAVCTCSGRRPQNCSFCHGRGFLSKFLWDRCVDQETKEIRRKAAAKR